MEAVKSNRPSSAEVIMPSTSTTTTQPESPSQNNPQVIPKTINLEMTPKLYQLMKERMLSQQNALVRNHIGTYFEWLRTLKPEDIVYAIETNTSLREAYSKAPFKWRLAIAAARAFLKSSKKYARQFRQVVDLELALITLKFENHTAYTTIQQYGKRGMAYLTQSLQDALVIFGVAKEKEPAKAA